MPNLRRLSSICAFSLFVAVCGGASGCALEPTPSGNNEEVGTSWDAIMSSQSLLSATQFRELQENLQNDIAETQATIEKLKKEIVVAEAANQAALNEANALLAQIEQRTAELRALRNETATGGIIAGVLGFLVGGPVGAAVATLGVGAGAVAISADSRLSALNVQLELARAKQRKAEADVAQYYARKKGLETHLEDIRTREKTFIGILAESTTPKTASPTFTPWPSVPKRARRIELMKQLLSNLKEQEAVLGDILVLAQALSPELKALVTELKGLREQADQMVEATQNDLWKIVAVLAAENPLGAATLWLESAVAARAKEALAELHISAVDYALWLVKVWDKGRSFAANPGEAVQQELVKKIVVSIESAGAADWTKVAQNPVVTSFVQSPSNP
jgi:hypothetical protein